jgi:hypothetical protein
MILQGQLSFWLDNWHMTVTWERDFSVQNPAYYSMDKIPLLVKLPGISSPLGFTYIFSL